MKGMDRFIKLYDTPFFTRLAIETAKMYVYMYMKIVMNWKMYEGPKLSGYNETSDEFQFSGILEGHYWNIVKKVQQLTARCTKRN